MVTSIQNLPSESKSEGSWGSAVPIPDRPFTPACLRIGEPLLQRREAGTLHSGSAGAPAWTCGRGFIEPGVKAQACDASDGDGAQLLQEVQRRKGTVSHQNQGAVG